ncbi:FAD/NAD(P)-binding domain-containing protein [Aspergillus steynii IBT 23096]|uniref:FAD/NAD(P)-binding domain-containing protein n=1 Tax=Aspergillus steynii IBT 23096 TaxID=1392250 RepID=A0A2I2FSV6_9EURO|nr:FAD/NAD(P)-binding domain-containing protein [Aspergillus steynii IBT 23096]PLB43704.1 FAD/NAD(P)-binding domain-containing protein [Aspergillus steynii IBT 23096]
MLRPKKVAIIGAGPSGLVAAKTLLHNYPTGTFSATIFDKSRSIGGLWPTSSRRHLRGGRGRGLIDPAMRTNLSRFTVGFSDLAWESVGGIGDGDGDRVPMFPAAWQVGRYLEGYAERYLPAEVMRLGCRVVRTVREMVGEGEGERARARWVLQWVCERENEDGHEELHSEEFDYLLVASGYFSRPHVPDIPGLSGFSDHTVHSSAVQGREDVQRLLESGSAGKVVVIGGSMSGVETASALATHLSSMDFTSGLAPRAGKAYEVHHVCSRPFWTVPCYLPHETPREDAQSGSVQFLPLDLVFYDLSRRPPGPIEYGFGPASPLQVTKVNQYFRSLLGSDYKDVGEKMFALDSGPGQTVQPSWIGIGDEYAEFVRSKSIHSTIGRVNAIHVSETGKARIDIQSAEGDTTSLDDVAAIVTATGLTPFSSLDFLPADVLATLEYSATDAFFPVVLDGKGSTNAQIPDMGFVGLYRGPYWGVMEMQARNVAESWFRQSTAEPCLSAEEEKKTQERRKVREFRNAGSTLQFPMGDYVGLMESFARDVGLTRSPLPTGEWPGPVIPARYTRGENENSTKGEDMDMQKEAQTTMDSLRGILSPTPGSHSLAMATAAFRALHGAWIYTQTSINSDSISGTAIFYPRYPSNQGFEKEYVCEEYGDLFADKTARSIYRLAGEGSNLHICIWDVDLARDPNSASRFSHGFCLAPAQMAKDGKFVVHATAAADGHGHRHEYAFQFDGVTISSWERTVDIDGSTIKTVYSRQ